MGTGQRVAQCRCNGLFVVGGYAQQPFRGAQPACELVHDFAARIRRRRQCKAEYARYASHERCVVRIAAQIDVTEEGLLPDRDWSRIRRLGGAGLNASQIGGIVDESRLRHFGAPPTDR